MWINPVFIKGFNWLQVQQNRIQIKTECMLQQIKPSIKKYAASISASSVSGCSLEHVRFHETPEWEILSG